MPDQNSKLFKANNTKTMKLILTIAAVTFLLSLSPASADELDNILDTITNPSPSPAPKKATQDPKSKASPSVTPTATPSATPKPSSTPTITPKDAGKGAKEGAKSGAKEGSQPSPTATPTAAAGAITGSSAGTQEDVIPLPPEVLPENVSAENKKAFGISEPIDPKEQVKPEEKGKDIPGLEETSIYVMRQITVKKDGGTEWETVRIPIPVYYRTRSVAWGQDQIRTALLIQQRIEEYTKKLEAIKKEGELLLSEYNKVILSGIPQEVLGADSPSFPPDTRKDMHVTPLRGKDLNITVEANN